MAILRQAVFKTANFLSFGIFQGELERAYYEGAKTSRLNRDFNLTNNHFEELAGSDRNLLKARARWLSANNPIVKSQDKSIIKNSIGTGIVVQSKVKEEDYKSCKEFNKAIETLWSEFIKKQNFDLAGLSGFIDYQKLALKHKLMDGEILVNKVWTKDKLFPLKFQMIESDMFDDTKTSNKSNSVFSGVEVNSVGKPIAYWLKEKINSYSSKSFSAENIIHFYDRERATQYRGITDYAQVINNLKDFAAYNDSEIIKNRILASFGLFIKTGNTAGSLFKDTQTGKAQGSPDPIKEITAGMIKYLRPNEEVQTVQSNQLGTSYSDFITTTVRLISAGRDLSYELSLRDYTKVNFSSARAGLIQDNKRFDDEQKSMTDNLLTPMFEAFVDSMVSANRLKAPNDYWIAKHKYIKPVWIMPRREWVDPVKDINAIEKEIALDINTKTKAAAAKGQNFEDIVDEKIAEEVMIKEKRKAACLTTTEEENDAKTA